MRRVAFRQTHKAQSSALTTRSKASILRNQQLELVPKRVLCSANSPKEAAQKNVPNPAHPQNKEPWWSPKNAYWLVDDLVYKAIEKIYDAVNWAAKAVGKKDGLSKVSVGAGAYLLGNTIRLIYKSVQNPESTPINLITLTFLGCISVLLIRTSRQIENFEGAIAESGKDTLARAVRLPMLAGLAIYDFAKWSAFGGAEVWIKDVPSDVGCIMLLYLLSGKNGMLNRAKDASKEILENSKAVLAPKAPSVHR